MSSSVKVDKNSDDEEENDCADGATNDLMPHASANQVIHCMNYLLLVQLEFYVYFITIVHQQC